MKKISKKFLRFSTLMVGATAIASTATVVINSVKKAEATSMNWHLRGRKKGFTTEINGVVEARYRGWFWNYAIFWDGLSRAWSPKKDFNNVQDLKHYIEVWVLGSGTPSLNIGISAGDSGINGAVSATTNSSENKATYFYHLKNQSRIEVNFSTSGYIWSWSYVGWKTRTSFLLKEYKFLDVDGQNNAVKDWRYWTDSLLENTSVPKFAPSQDNRKELVDNSTEWPYE